MSENNLGRVQGGGFFGSTSTSTESIPKDTVISAAVKPLKGDTIVNANGDLCVITSVGSSAYTVSKYGSIKGATGSTPSLAGYATESFVLDVVANAITTALNTAV